MRMFTFKKPKFLKEISTYKRITEIQEESTEKHPFTIDIAGVRSGADVAYGHLELTSRNSMDLSLSTD